MPEHNNPKDFDQQSNFNLLDLMIVLLKHKWLIITFVVLTVISSVARIAIHNRHINADTGQSSKNTLYYSESIIEPYSLSVDKTKALLTSRSLTIRLIEKNNLMPVIFHDSWDEKKQQWISGSQPAIEDAYRRVVGKLEFKSENNLLKMIYSDNNPNLPQKLIDLYILSLSDYLMSQDLATLSNQIDFIQEKVTVAKDPYLKSRLTDQIMDLLEKQRRAKNDKYYGFHVIDPPYKSVASAPVQAVKPLSKMSMIPLIMASLTVAIALAFFIEYLKAVKRKNPEQFESLKRYMGLR